MSDTLTPRQKVVIAALLHLHDFPPTIGELSAATGRSVGSMRAMIATLVRDGLVERAGCSSTGAATYRATEQQP